MVAHRHATESGCARVLAILLCLGALGLGAGERVAVVDPSIAGPVWRGWGTSLAWWANTVGGYAEPLRSQLCDTVFRDLGLNIVRYCVGAGESVDSDAMEPRARMPRFLTRELSYDWSADANQRWVLQRAKVLGADTFEAFACSPPPWMTRSGSVTGGVGGASNLRQESVRAFAQYLAKVARHFRDEWGILFETISPLNEPEADWWKSGGRQEGCRVEPGTEQSLLLVTLDQALRERQLSARTSGPESWWPRRAAESWDMLDEAARRTMGHISTHGYGGGEGRAELRDRAQRAHLPVWISEYGDADASGLTLARQIVRDVRELQPSAWVYWQAVDAGGWGCIDLDMNKAAAEPRHNRKFDMFAQFTRHIRPGARMVGVSDESTVAALQSDRVVVVTVGGETDGSLRIDVSRVDTTGEPARVIRSSESEAQVEQPPVAAQQGSLRLEVPAKSVVTVVVPVRAVKPAEPNVGHGKAGAATTGSTPSL